MLDKIKKFITSWVGKVLIIGIILIGTFMAGYLYRGRSIENKVLGQIDNVNTNLSVMATHLSAMEAQNKDILNKLKK